MKKTVWVSEVIRWAFKCKCGVIKGEYVITPIGVVSGEFPPAKCKVCKKKWNKKTGWWKSMEVRVR